MAGNYPSEEENVSIITNKTWQEMNESDIYNRELRSFHCNHVNINSKEWRHMADCPNIHRPISKSGRYYHPLNCPNQNQCPMMIAFKQWKYRDKKK